MFSISESRPLAAAYKLRNDGSPTAHDQARTDERDASTTGRPTAHSESRSSDVYSPRHSLRTPLSNALSYSLATDSLRERDAEIPLIHCAVDVTTELRQQPCLVEFASTD
jgi:hypothetical protein